MSNISKRLTELGITLPPPPVAVAAYVPYVITGNLVFIAGQISLKADGTPVTGKVGSELDLEAGKNAARLCALNILAHLSVAFGG